MSNISIPLTVLLENYSVKDALQIMAMCGVGGELMREIALDAAGLVLPIWEAEHPKEQSLRKAVEALCPLDMAESWSHLHEAIAVQSTLNVVRDVVYGARKAIHHINSVALVAASSSVYRTLDYYKTAAGVTERDVKSLVLKHIAGGESLG